MSPDSLQKSFDRIFSPTSHLFGRVRTLHPSADEYAWSVCEPTESLYPLLCSLSEEQRKNLSRILMYFELHLRPLSKLLKEDDEDAYDKIAWSHFAMIIMFGMLECGVKVEKGLAINDQLDQKGSNIAKFLERYLPEHVKDAIVVRYKKNRYQSERVSNKNFFDVVMHAWEEVRCGFTHNVGVEWLGLDFGGFTLEGEKDGVPLLSFYQDVPIQEWLMLAWLAILKSFGYTGDILLKDTVFLRLQEERRRLDRCR